MNEREREIVRFALAYLAANVEDFLGDWPEFFVDSGDFPALKGQPPTENEINDMLASYMKGGQHGQD